MNVKATRGDWMEWCYDLFNDRRMMWRVIRMDSTMIGIYLKSMSDSNEMENR